MRPPAVAITGIGVVSPYGVGRERFWQHIRRGCSATRTITEFDATPYGCTVAAPVPPVSIEDAVAIDGAGAGDRDGRSAAAVPIRGDIRARRSSASSPRPRRGATPGCALGEPDAGVLVGSGAGGIDVAERQYFEFFTDGWKRVTPYAIPVSIVGMLSSEISIALELHGISHVVSTGLHELDRRNLVRRGAHPERRGRGHPVRRRRRLRDARDDVRLLEDARRVGALQRPAGGRVAAVRCRPRRLRARRRRLDGGARARGSRACARRVDLRDHRRPRVDVRRLPPRADGSRRHADRPRDAAGHRAIRPGRSRRLAT